MFEQNVYREGRNILEPNSTRLEDEQVWGSSQGFMEVMQGLYVWSSGQLNLSDEGLPGRLLCQRVVPTTAV